MIFERSKKKANRPINIICLILMCLIAIQVLCAAPNAVDDELQSERSELEKLRERLKSQQRGLDSLVRSKKSVSEELKRIEESRQLESKLLKQLGRVQDKLKGEVDDARGDLSQAQYALRRQKNALMRRMRTLYIGQSHNPAKGWELLFENSLSGYNRLVWMGRIASYDSSLVQKYLKEKQTHTVAINKLEKRKTELTTFEKEKQLEVERLSKDQRERENRLQNIQSDEKLRRKALNELKENAAALEKIIRTLEKKRQEAKAKKIPEQVLQRTGKACPPVLGKQLTKFGLQFHETLKTTTKNLGIEILGAPGEKVHSALAGEVVFVDRLPGYGQGVIIYNGSGYYTIYGNMRNIVVKVGDKVVGCQDLASVPESAELREQKIYFEVRKERESLDPIPWLKKF